MARLRVVAGFDKNCLGVVGIRMRIVQPPRALAERLRTQVHAATWSHQPVTVSMGITSIERVPCDADTLLNQADQALYRAKFHGRDQAVHYLDISHSESDCRNKT